MSTDKQERIALFRFGIIAGLVGLKKSGYGQREKLLREIVGRQWLIPGSQRSYVSRSVVMEWLKRYEESDGDLKSLYPKPRIDKGRLRSMDLETEQSVIKLNPTSTTIMRNML